MSGGEHITFHDIRKTFGLEVADKITAQYGGGCLYIPAPQKISKDHSLARLLGHATAQKVALFVADVISAAGHVSGIQIKVPCGATGRRAQSDAQMRALISAGLSAHEIARRLSVDEKTVRRHRKALRERMVRSLLVALPDEDIAIQFDVTPGHIAHMRQFVISEIKRFAADGFSDEEIAGRFGVGKVDIRRFYTAHVLNNHALNDERKNG